MLNIQDSTNAIALKQETLDNFRLLMTLKGRFQAFLWLDEVINVCKEANLPMWERVGFEAGIAEIKQKYGWVDFYCSESAVK